jgi:hypothetical protein
MAINLTGTHAIENKTTLAATMTVTYYVKNTNIYTCMQIYGKCRNTELK